MRLAIRYATAYIYGVEVGESQNALRVCPADSYTQRLLDYTLSIDPSTELVSFTDYWGTRVDLFGINERHTRLAIVADAHVETVEPVQPTDALLPADPIVDYEYQAASPHVQWGDQVAEWARDVGSGASTPIAKTLAIHHAIGDRMDFVTDATEVGTPVSEIFEKHQGVCQDYSHLALAAYRSVGMAARYVSGYFYAAASGAEPTSDEIQVETHAWVEVAIPGFGWWGLDPTNQQVASERHVKIGHGRDYEDVTPLRGIYHGETDSTELRVGVTMSRSDLGSAVIEPQPVAVVQQQQQQQ